ncbi:DNA repair protein RadA [Corynebacterium ulceribovis]|uniref:DNA repair protein RadA n=1 Tax=Corynebacterium ulceribovis TaxID=487732 RepID=UPI0003710463|nr:DNA repair protein RadA [Corynebacterium ulceribovis]
MAKKPRTTYVCSSCGWQGPKWVGRCPTCGDWGTVEEQQPAPTTVSLVAGGAAAAGVTDWTARAQSGLTPKTAAAPITTIDPNQTKVLPTGIGELDRVLGRGIVPGSVVLLAGEPGVGKSTLLLEVAARWAQQPAGDNGNRTALYVTAEESAGQVRLRADRTGALVETLYLAAESDLDTVFGHVAQLQPSLLVVDSVQTMQATGVDGAPGGVAQTRAVTAALTSLAKATGIAVLLVGHVTKDGNVAGPRVLEHLVDVVLHFEGDRHSGLRMVRGVKNRFGATDEVGCFEQTADGIAEVPDPTGLFLHHRTDPVPGTAVTVLMDGRRPLLAEIQGLAVPVDMHNPRRVVSGADSQRVPMITAVLAQRAGVNLTKHEIYVATVGGMKVSEPASDLAVAVALASSISNRATSSGLVVLGEVGLAGEIRRVPNLGRRLQEAQRMGFTRAVIPKGNTEKAPKGMQVVRASTLAEALRAAETA